MKGKVIVLNGFPEPSGNRLAIWVPEKDNMVFLLNRVLNPPMIWLNAEADLPTRLVAELSDTEVPDAFVEELFDYETKTRSLSKSDNEIRTWLTQVAGDFKDNPHLDNF